MKNLIRFLSGIALLPVAAQAQIIGYEPFDYTGNPVDANGGVFWDFKNATARGHSTNASAWHRETGLSGASACSAGILYTAESGVIREYAGPDVTGETEGAVHGSSVDKKVYYRITMTRGTGTTWCGVSSFDFATERLFFGLYPGRAGNFGIYNQTTYSPIVESTVPVNVGETYTLVAKVDFAADVVSLYVNPNVNGTELSNTPVATAAYTRTNWSTALRVASGGSGLAAWDDLTCATTWESLRTHAVTNSAPAGPGSLQAAALEAGAVGGRVTFPHVGAIYAVRATTGGQRLIRFNRHQPGVLTLDVPLTGLQPLESISGIDFRTEGGTGLYAMGVIRISGEANDIGRLYTINTATGAATLVGSGPFSSTLADSLSINGFDFEYRSVPHDGIHATIRVTNNLGLNLRLNPDTGTVAGNDTILSMPDITGIASGVWNRDENPATLYGIDSESDTPGLWRIGGIDGNPSAGGGTVTRIGPFTQPFSRNLPNGFDIGDDGTAWLSSVSRETSPFSSYLHTVDLKTGATTQIGQIGTLSGPLYGMSVASTRITAINLASGPRDTIIDGGSDGGIVRIGFSDAIGLEINTGEALALRNLQIESTAGPLQHGGGSAFAVAPSTPAAVARSAVLAA